MWQGMRGFTGILKGPKTQVSWRRRVKEDRSPSPSGVWGHTVETEEGYVISVVPGTGETSLCEST